MRRVALALAAVLLWLLPLPAGAAVDPTPEPTDPLASWIATEAPQLVVASETSNLSAEERTRVVIGAPVDVWAWSDAFASGSQGSEPIEMTQQRAAPLSLDGVGVGVLVVTADETGTVTDHHEVWDPALGAAIMAVPEASFVYDEEVDGWFRVAGEILTPITANAKDVLAGSLPVDDYQPYLTARTQPIETPVAVEETGGGGMGTPVLIAAVVVFGLLAIAAGSVWSRRPIPEEET